MKVTELTKTQLIELKGHYLCEKQNNTSYEDLVNADKLVSDKEIYEVYSGYSFTEDDFSN